MKNKISIIIPTYNRKHLQHNPKKSQKLLIIYSHQTLHAHEIIVIDDHSTDGTIEWFNKHYGNKIIVLKNKGKGPGAARNTGLEISTGDYIKFFDSDDVMTMNTLRGTSRDLRSKLGEKLCHRALLLWQPGTKEREQLGYPKGPIVHYSTLLQGFSTRKKNSFWALD